MSESRFTDEELARFERRFALSPAWRRWHRRGGFNGEDVIEISVAGAGRTPCTVKMAKTDARQYVAAGLDGWGLTICESFDDLLDIVGRMSPPAFGYHGDGAMAAE